MLFEIKKIHSPINRIIITLHLVITSKRKCFFVNAKIYIRCSVRSRLVFERYPKRSPGGGGARIKFRVDHVSRAFPSPDFNGGDGLISLINVTLGLAFVEGIGAEQVSSS